MIRSDLRQYIEESILPKYESFDAAHQHGHVASVIKASLRYARLLNVDEEVAFVIAAYHDIGLSEGREFHHVSSARMLLEDERLRDWFDKEMLQTMAEAVEDHRASNKNEPRSGYGKIVAEADRQIDPQTIIRRTIQFSLTHYPNYNKEQHLERVKAHLKEKYDEGGYLRLWIAQSDNAEKLNELRRWIKDERKLDDTFEKLYNRLIIQEEHEKD